MPIYRISKVDLLPFDNKIKSINELDEKMATYANGIKKTLETNDFYFCQHSNLTMNMQSKAIDNRYMWNFKMTEDFRL